MLPRVFVIVLVGLFVVASVGGALVWSVAPEQLVEGHTVFATISSPPIIANNSTKAAAVAVLVRESSTITQSDRFPGVLWWNDQYLVDPITSEQTCTGSGGIRLGPIQFGGGCQSTTRYPCTGAVLAVNQGDPDPRLYQLGDYLANYVETYHIEDPNDNGWDVHKWNMSGDLVWTVAIRNNTAASDLPDDGHCNRNPFKDSAAHKNNPTDYGYPGYSYPCGGVDGLPCAKAVQYNAVLFFLLDDLHEPGYQKDHTPGSFNYTHDVSGCDNNWNNQFTDNWPCPQDDDNREGNSHPYNPRANDTGNEERGTHGFSADCDGDGIYDRNCHATRMVDIYYGIAPQPLIVNYVILDDVGREARFHCHEDPDPALDQCV